MAAFATSRHPAAVAIADVDVAVAAAALKNDRLLLRGWSDSALLSSRSRPSRSLV